MTPATAEFTLVHQPTVPLGKDGHDTIEEAIYRLGRYRLSRVFPLASSSISLNMAYGQAIEILAQRYPTASADQGEWLIGHNGQATRIADWNENICALYLERFPLLRTRLKRRLHLGRATS